MPIDMTTVGPDPETDVLSGSGRYVDDLRFANEAFAVVLRSPHAHAAIRSIDLTEANAADGAYVDAPCSASRNLNNS